MSALSVLSFLLLFRDTFRKERSLTYQKILKERTKEKEAHDAKVVEKQKPDTRERDLERLEATSVAIKEIKLSFADINPIKPMWGILKQWHNLITISASG